MKYYLYKIYKFLPIRLRWAIAYLITDKYLVGVTAFVIKNKKILLLKNTYQYYWSLPGGYLNKNESFKEGIERELKEELGISVIMEKIIDIKNLHQKSIIDVVVLCKFKSGAININKNEVEDACFFNIFKLPQNTIIWESQQPYLDLLKKSSKKINH